MRVFFVSIFSVLFFFQSQSLGYEVSFDCGGTGCTMDGKEFLADVSYPGSQAAGYLDGSECSAHSFSITGGPFQPPSICDAYRQGDFSYQFDVPNGNYAVTLYFNEFQVHGPGLRQFPIMINRTVHHDDFDIWSRAGMFYAFSVRFPVTVTDGMIVASFGSSLNACVLAGISVKNIQDSGLVPDPPSGMTTTASYEAVNLSWDFPGDEAAGVNIYRGIAPAGPFTLVGARSDLAPFWVDRQVLAGTTYYYQLTTNGMNGAESNPSAITSATVLETADSTRPIYSISMSEDDLDQLRQYPNLDLYFNAHLAYDGMDFGPVGVRYRGALSRVISHKKSWKIKLENGLLNGRDRFNLNGDFLDLSQIVPLTSFACFGQTQCLSPETHKSNLLVNGNYHGQFSEVEQVDELFLEKRGITQIGNIYKCNSDLQVLPYSFYPLKYEKKTNTAFGYDDLVTFIETINNTPQSELDDRLFPLVNLESQVDYYATRIFLADYDFFMRNYYLYHHLATDKWEIIPWDLDLALDIYSVLSSIDLGTSQTPSPNGWNRLFDRLISVPKYRRYYCDRLVELLDTTFAQESFATLADSLANTVREDLDRDFWKLRFDEENLFPMRLNQIKSFCDQRRSFLHSAIVPFLAEVNGLFINEVLVLNESTIADNAQQFDSYIELFNWSDHPLQLADYYLSDGSGDPLSGALPDEILPARSFALFWADNQPQQGAHHLPFLLNEISGQVVLYHQDNMAVAVDSLAYGFQTSDVALAVPHDGWWPFQEANPSPGATNEVEVDGINLFLNEFMALNQTTVTDPQGEYEDWVELYNPGTEEVNLTGFHLSDDLSNLTRWAFPAGTSIAPGSFLVVWCDADELDSGLHANFKLSAAGEAIALSGPSCAGGSVIDQVSFGIQTADVSRARFPDGGSEWDDCFAPTPGMSNSSASTVDLGRSPFAFRLQPASPNPASGKTNIVFSLGSNLFAPIELAVFDVRGRKVRTLVRDTAGTGEYSVVWDRRDDGGHFLPSGVYFVRLKSLQSIATQKIVLIH